MALSFHTEKLEDVAKEILPLLQKHYEEIAWNKEKVPFNPDWDRYRQLEAAGALRIYIAREDGELVGYAVFCVSRMLHYQDVVQAQNDIFYVVPSKRGLYIGRKLLQEYAEAELKREGVHDITLHIKLAHDWSKLAQHWGYEATDLLLHKWIA